MANRFWVGDGGNWSDNTNHWSASTGGAPNASLPTSADRVYFDAASFTIPAQTVTVDATANCLDMDWTGATNTPTLYMPSFSIAFYGNVTLIANMVIPSVTRQLSASGAGATTLTTNGLSIGCYLTTSTAFTGSLTLLDNLAVSYITHNRGTFATGNNNITIDNAVGYFYITGANAKTLTLGSSTINLTSGANWLYDGTNLTLTANTATINCSGNFAGGGLTYNIVNLTGATSTVSGSNTFATLALPSGTTQTITFTDGTTQTATTATLDGDATHAHTIKSGTAGTLASLIATTVTETHVTYTDMRLSWETLTVGDVIVNNRELSFAETENIRIATKWRYQ